MYCAPSGEWWCHVAASIWTGKVGKGPGASMTRNSEVQYERDTDITTTGEFSRSGIGCDHANDNIRGCRTRLIPHRRRPFQGDGVEQVPLSLHQWGENPCDRVLILFIYIRGQGHLPPLPWSSLIFWLGVNALFFFFFLNFWVDNQRITCFMQWKRSAMNSDVLPDTQLSLLVIHERMEQVCLRLIHHNFPREIIGWWERLRWGGHLRSH